MTCSCKRPCPMTCRCPCHEDWRPIPGWLAYEASNTGQVRRVRPNSRRQVGHLMRQWLHKTGYFYVALHQGTRRKNISVHTLVALAFLGEPSVHPAECDHRNGDKADNRLENLEWCTSSENKYRAIELGLTPVGERHYAARLTVDAVRQIRATIKTVTATDWAKRLGVSRQTVTEVRRGHTWKTVE